MSARGTRTRTLPEGDFLPEKVFQPGPASSQRVVGDHEDVPHKGVLEQPATEEGDRAGGTLSSDCSPTVHSSHQRPK